LSVITSNSFVMKCSLFVITLLVAMMAHFCQAAGKKGMAIQHGLVNCGDMDFLNVDWWWDWQTDKLCPAREFVPMIWGRGNLPNIAHLPPGSDWLMGFNEPNNPYAGQDVMSPEEAASHWPDFEKSGRKLLSPSPAIGGSMSYKDWLNGFFKACSNCTVDAVGIHIYSNNADYVMSVIEDIYNSFKKPVWLTEFCAPNGSPQANLDFLKVIIPRLEASPAVQRYSWIADRWTFDQVAAGAALLTPDTSKFDLTLPGTYFKALPA